MEIKQSSIKAFASEAYDKIKTFWNGKVVTFLSKNELKNLLEKPHVKPFLVAATLTGVLFLTIFGSLKAFRASKANKKAAAKLDEPTAATNLEKIKALEEQKIKKLEEKGEIQIQIIELRKEIRKMDKNSYRNDKNSFKALIPRGSNLESALIFSYNYADIWSDYRWGEQVFNTRVFFGEEGDLEEGYQSFKSTLNSLNNKYETNSESFEGIDERILLLSNAIQSNKDALDAIEKKAKPLLTDHTQVEHFEKIGNTIEQQTAKKIDNKRTARSTKKQITQKIDEMINLAEKYSISAIDRKERLKDLSRGLPSPKDILNNKILPEGCDDKDILEFICGKEGALINKKINHYSKDKNLNPLLKEELDRLTNTYNQIQDDITEEMDELKQIVEIKRLSDRLEKTITDSYSESKHGPFDDIEEYNRNKQLNINEIILTLEKLEIPKTYLEKHDAFIKASNDLNSYKFNKYLIENNYQSAERLGGTETTNTPSTAEHLEEMASLEKILVDNSNIVEKLKEELVQLENEYPKVKYIRLTRLKKRKPFDDGFYGNMY